MTQPNASRIPALKRAMRVAVIKHDRARAHLDCGSNMAAVINPDVAKWARMANGIARELQGIDPAFPKEWSPIPEGT